MLSVNIRRELGRAEVDLSGGFSFSEVVTLMHRLDAEADPARVPDLLVDCTGVTDAPSAGDVRLLARRVKAMDDGRRARGAPVRRRRAVVVPSLVLYGLARMFELLRNDDTSDLAVFRTRADAEAWLAQAPAPR